VTGAPTLTGQDINLAANATRALLDSLLTRTATSFHQWVVLNFAGSSGGVVQQDAAVERMVFALKIDPATASTTIHELVELGLATTDGADLALTPAGTARFEQIRDSSAAITDRLYGDLPLNDLVTTRRVLATVTERANAELATAPGADRQ
jgi:DNA-binding MarR family transcriptional regulator